MATFAGVTFGERGSGGGALFPLHGNKQKVAILIIPGGAKVILQCLGYDASPLDIPAKVTAAQLASLRALVGTSGSLVYVGGTVTVSLVDVGDPVEVKYPNDVFETTLHFLTALT